MFHKLKSVPVRKLIKALEHDGFQYKKRKGSQRVYRHGDGRRVVIHFHHANDTLPPGTLRSVLQGARWEEGDLKRLGLLVIKRAEDIQMSYRLLKTVFDEIEKNYLPN